MNILPSDMPVDKTPFIIDTLLLVNAMIVFPVLTLGLLILYLKDIVVFLVNKKNRLSLSKVLIIWLISLILAVIKMMGVFNPPQIPLYAVP